MKIKLRNKERLDDLLLDDLKLIQDPDYFCFSLDAVLLASFIEPNTNSKVLDLGTGSGIIPHLIQAKYKLNRVYGIDIIDEVIDMAKRSAIYNGLTDKLRFITLDLNKALDHFGTEAFDYIVSNPPYMKEGSGKINLEDKLAVARHEIKCNLEDVIRVSSQLVKYGGKVAYVYRTQRLAELLSLMESYNLSCKRMRFIHSKEDSKANLVLVEAKKGGGVGLEVLPPLVIYKEDGDYTKELEDIYYPKKGGI